MKKHILGFALFSFIVASFAIVFAFFYAPSIPPKEAVKPPVTTTETRTGRGSYCNMNRSNLTYEVLSSQYFVFDDKIVSKIRVSLNNSIRVAPSKIYVGTTFSSAGNLGKNGFGDYQVIENPFAESREKIVTVVTNVANGKKLDIDENLYVMVSVTDYDGQTGSKKSTDVTQAKAVRFVYDDKTSAVFRAKRVTE